MYYQTVQIINAVFPMVAAKHFHKHNCLLIKKFF